MKRSPEVLLSEQLTALSRIVNHAYKHSQFYQKRFKKVGFQPGDIRNFSDLKELPELTKADLINNMDDILCAPKDELSTASTGGTSGIHLTFYRDKYCQVYRQGIDLALTRYYGWKDGQWQGWLWGSAQDVQQSSGIKDRLIRQWANRQYFMDVSNLSDENYQNFVEKTRKYRPTFVSAYPSVAFDLAERIESGTVDAVRIPVISLTAEVVYDFQKERIRSSLADNVYERYGAREYGTAAFECFEKSGMHIFAESVYLESTAFHNSEGDSNVLLVTDLLNTAMPLIRYDSGDLGKIDTTPCPCGLPSPRIQNIQGRKSDTIWRHDGTGVAGTHVVTLVGRGMINARIQIVQETINKIIIRIERKDNEFQRELETLVKVFKEEIGSDILYQIESTDKIERAVSGKYQYVISRVKRPDSNST